MGYEPTTLTTAPLCFRSSALRRPRRPAPPTGPHGVAVALRIPNPTTAGRFRLRSLLRRAVRESNHHWRGKSSPTRIRTAVAGFRVLSANHYTMGEMAAASLRRPAMSLGRTPPLPQRPHLRFPRAPSKRATHLLGLPERHSRALARAPKANLTSARCAIAHFAHSCTQAAGEAFCERFSTDPPPSPLSKRLQNAIGRVRTCAGRAHWISGPAP